MKPVRCASRITNGTRSAAAPSDSAKLPASLTASGNRYLAFGRAFAVERDHVVDCVVDRVARGPAGSRLQLLRHRLAVRDLFEARLVSDLERDVANLGARARALDDAIGELLDSDLLGRADVEDVADRRVGLNEREQRAHGVVHVHEAAALRPVAVDREVVAGQRLLDEARQDHSVLARLARPDGVEEPDDNVLGAVVLVVAEREDLAEGLRGRVAPARRGGGTENALGLLMQRAAAVLAVDLRRRGVEQLLAKIGCSAGDDVAAPDVAERRLERPVDNQLDTDRSGHVQAYFDALHELADERLVGHRA